MVTTIVYLSYMFAVADCFRNIVSEWVCSVIMEKVQLHVTHVSHIGCISIYVFFVKQWV